VPATISIGWARALEVLEVLLMDVFMMIFFMVCVSWGDGKPKRGKRAEFFLSLAGNKHRFGDTLIRFMQAALRRLPYIAKNKSSDIH
jgi:hypothetical protein